MEHIGSRLAVALVALSAGFFAHAAAAAGAVLQATDDEVACLTQNVAPIAELRADGSSVMRLIVSPGYLGQGQGCVAQAEAAGYRVYLSLVYSNTDSVAEDVAYFEAAVSTYDANGQIWAISIGNEQEDPSPTSSSPQQYRVVWDAVEPKLPANAIHVFGDSSPWGEAFDKAAWGSSAPAGVEAVAFHAYYTTWGGLAAVPEFAAWAASRGVPFWLSETTPALDDPSMLAATVAASPDVQLVGDYEWPGIEPGALGWAAPTPSASAAASFVAAVTATAVTEKDVSRKAAKKCVAARTARRNRTWNRHHRHHWRPTRVCRISRREHV